MNHPLPSWLPGITAKHPDVALIVHAMLICGVRYGQVTADDVAGIRRSSDKTPGAAAKYMRLCGFKVGRYIPSTQPKRHGGVIAVWVLNDRPKAERIMRALAGMVTGLRAAVQAEQTEMVM